MVFNKLPFTRCLLILVVLLFAVVGCDKDNPVEPHEEHNEADGMVLKIDSVNIVVVKEGEVESGNITVKAGETTQEISARFLDHDEDEFIPDEEGSSLAFEIADETIAEAAVVSGKEWEFKVTGLTVDSTTIVVKLIHHDHADFRTPPIPLVVTNY